MSDVKEEEIDKEEVETETEVTTEEVNDNVDNSTEKNKTAEKVEKKSKNKDDIFSNSTIDKQTMTPDVLYRIIGVAVLASLVNMVGTNLSFAPVFYKLEISDSLILMGGIALGPIAVAYMQLLKILLNFFISGTVTAGVGEMAGFIMGVSYSMTAAIVFHQKREFKQLVIGVISGTAILGLVSALVNYFFLIPAYSTGYGLPMEAIIGMGASVNSKITNLEELVLYATIPFNLVKGAVNSVITLMLYRYICPLLMIKKKKSIYN